MNESKAHTRTTVLELLDAAGFDRDKPTHKHSHTHTHTRTHTHTHAHTLSLTHRHTHTHTRITVSELLDAAGLDLDKPIASQQSAGVQEEVDEDNRPIRDTGVVLGV